jgi:hypothetical protein
MNKMENVCDDCGKLNFCPHILCKGYYEIRLKIAIQLAKEKERERIKRKVQKVIYKIYGEKGVELFKKHLKKKT